MATTTNEAFLASNNSGAPITTQQSAVNDKSDPRWNIMQFFQKFVTQYDEKQDPAFAMSKIDYDDESASTTQRPASFSVWRTASMDAIRLMMSGEGTGKGPDIKGKSAMCGKLSGFIPLVQIHNNDKDKKRVGTCPANTRVRIFYSSRELRDEASVQLKKVMLHMIQELKTAKEAMGVPDIDPDEYEEALQKMVWKMTKPKVIKVDDYIPKSWGLDIPERLLWEAYVARGNCVRKRGSDLDTGRKSDPHFFFMNLYALRDPNKSQRVVIWQSDPKKAMEPMTLLMAYEENNRITPVVANFDPFLIGTRGLPYEKPLPQDQVEILLWCVNEIEGILKAPNNGENWSNRWMGVLKKAAKSGFNPKIPKFGYGDPMSCSIVENAIGSLKRPAAIRRGTECFNFYVPQALDDEFMIICPSQYSDLPYKYVSQYQLIEFLKQRVEEGFTFPLNPKWVLCDPGWIDIWDALHSSKHPHVQESLNAWYPPESGVREKIKLISAGYPRGFSYATDDLRTAVACPEDMDMAMLELKRHMTLQRAKRKLRIVVRWMSIGRKHSSKNDQNNQENNETNKQQKEAESKPSSTGKVIKTNSEEDSLEIQEKTLLKKLNKKRYELEKKEKDLKMLEQEILHKLKILSNKVDVRDVLDEIKMKELEIEEKEKSLSTKELKLKTLESEINVKLKNLMGTKKHIPIELELKEIEMWRKESELEVKEVELSIRSEKLSVRENEIVRRKANADERNP